MENIIKSILEIDQMAKDKIYKAESERNRIIAEAKLEEEQIAFNKIREADRKLEDLIADEKYKAEAKLAEIDTELKSETKRLDDAFAAHNREWQENIFNAIVNS